MTVRVVHVLVHAQHQGRVLARGGRGYDDLLCSARPVAGGSGRVVKNPVDSTTMSTPRSPHGRSAGFRSASTLTSLPSISRPVIGRAYLAGVRAVVAIVLEEVRVGGRVAQVVDRRNHQLPGVALDDCARHLPPDPAKAVDADASDHVSLSNFCG